MKLKDYLVSKEHSRGINAHTTWIYFDNANGFGFAINHNHDVVDGYYIGGAWKACHTLWIDKRREQTMVDYGCNTGEGCNTIWYPTLKAARDEVRRLFKQSMETDDEVKVVRGEDAKLCGKCRCHYSSNSKMYKKYSDCACNEFKQKHVEKAVLRSA